MALLKWRNFWISETVVALKCNCSLYGLLPAKWGNAYKEEKEGKEEEGHNGKTQLHALTDMTLAQGESCGVVLLVVM